jgi:hypothetical protein
MLAGLASLAGFVLSAGFVLLMLLLPFDIAGVAVLAGAGVEVLAGAVFAGLLVLVVLLVLVPSLGQAAPNKPNVKTAERAITFFISIKFSCLLQRMYIYFIV